MWVLILIKSYKLASEHDLLCSRYQCKYIEPPGIGKTGFARSRFNYVVVVFLATGL